jgi:molybdopterin/thiamine biosynthesis adenylyltransferase
LKIPLVHGAIAGFMGQVAVIRPGRPLLAAIYGRQTAQIPDRGVETNFGNPSFTPAVVAAWQAAEAVKLLAGLGASLDDTLLLIDLFSGETTRLALTAAINEK